MGPVVGEDGEAPIRDLLGVEDFRLSARGRPRPACEALLGGFLKEALGSLRRGVLGQGAKQKIAELRAVRRGPQVGAGELSGLLALRPEAAADGQGQARLRERAP